MRLGTTLLSALLLVTLSAACAGDSKQPSPTVAVTLTPAATPKPAPSATTGSPAAPGALTEVTGIIGNVNTRTNRIQIERRSGAAVTTISVVPDTVIEMAGGGRTTLAQLRPSDRIVAEGALNERGDSLVATKITVSQVVPGAGTQG